MSRGRPSNSATVSSGPRSRLVFSRAREVLVQLQLPPRPIGFSFTANNRRGSWCDGAPASEFSRPKPGELGMYKPRPFDDFVDVLDALHLLVPPVCKNSGAKGPWDGSEATRHLYREANVHGAYVYRVVTHSYTCLVLFASLWRRRSCVLSFQRTILRTPGQWSSVTICARRLAAPVSKDYLDLYK